MGPQSLFSNESLDAPGRDGGPALTGGGESGCRWGPGRPLPCLQVSACPSAVRPQQPREAWAPPKPPDLACAQMYEPLPLSCDSFT